MKPMPLHRNLLLWLSLVLAAALVAIPTKAPAQAAADQVPDGPTKLLRFADISKDKVVFAYAGDLWIASREGGAAADFPRRRRTLSEIFARRQMDCLHGRI